jgi:hypothetical protein
VTLQIERHDQNQAIARQWLRANGSARRSRKLPVVVLSGRGCPGNLLIIHEVDLAAIAAQQAELTESLNDR